MRRLPRLLALLPLLVVLAAPVAVPGAATQEGQLLTVVNFGDGPPGSLRYLIEHTAKPGAVIRFAQPLVVNLERPILIPGGLPALTIDGGVGSAHAALRYTGGRSGAGGAAVLGVGSDGTTVTGLRIEGEVVVAGATPLTEVAGTRVVDNDFAGANGRVVLSRTHGTLVQGNTFAGADDAVLTSLDTGARIVGNTFEAEGKRAVEGISDRLTLRRNTFTRTYVKLELKGASIDRNTFRGGSVSPLTIIGGEGAVTVTGNAFDLGGGSVRLLAADGEISAVNNTVRGEGGLTITCAGNARSGARAGALENRISSTGGIVVNCDRDVAIDVVGNTVTGGTGAGIAVGGGSSGPIELRGNVVTGNEGDGVRVVRGTKVRSQGGRIVGNGGAGVNVAPAARATVWNAALGGNGGPGIVAPAAASPPQLEYEQRRSLMRGRACPACRVQLYASETGAKQGNPNAGEGLRVIGTVTAKGDGTFVFPAKGKLRCPAGGKVTATATDATRGTSAFALDEECACTIDQEFVVDVGRVPQQGFWNPGIVVSFLNGTAIRDWRLEDAKTGKQPSRGALGPTVTWEAFGDRRGPPDRDSGRFHREWFVNVSDNRNDAGPPSRRQARWRFVVHYTPPSGASECGGRVAAVTG